MNMMQDLPPVNVPIDDPDADTEWNDILRKHKIIPEKPPSREKEIEEALVQAEQLAHENRLESRDLDELDELEDIEDEDFLEQYRQKRLAEMREVQNKARFGHVFLIAKNEWAREVTETSCTDAQGNAAKDDEEVEGKAGTFVFVHMSHASVPESVHLSRVLQEASPIFPEVKFCEILGARAVEGWPKARCPSLLVYRMGDVVDTILGWKREWGVAAVADLLVREGAVGNEDMRVLRARRNREEEGLFGKDAERSEGEDSE